MAHTIDLRHKILHNFSLWTALCATRSGCPIKSRKDIYSILGKVNFNEILYSQKPISEKQFENWHKTNTMGIMKHTNKRLCAGWASKLLNVYLKTSVYVGQIGRPGLIQAIHPPLDTALWQGLSVKYLFTPVISTRVFSKTRIKEIVTYTEYMNIITGLKLVAKEEKCELIEVEKYWNVVPTQW